MLKGAECCKFFIRHPVLAEVAIKSFLQYTFVGKIGVMSNVPSGDSPALLNGIQIRRIWGEFYQFNFLADITVFLQRFLLHQAERLLMPRCIVYDHTHFFTVFDRILGHEIPIWLDNRFVVEPRGFRRNELSRLRDDVTTVRHVFSSGRGSNFRLWTLTCPFARNRCCYLEMDFILKNEDARIIGYNFCRFF